MIVLCSTPKCDFTLLNQGFFYFQQDICCAYYLVFTLSHYENSLERMNGIIKDIILHFNHILLGFVALCLYFF